MFLIGNIALRRTCPTCGVTDQPIHRRLPCYWRHLNFFHYQALPCKARGRRVRCTACPYNGRAKGPSTRPVRAHCPSAAVSFDQFHVIALANEPMNQARRAEVKHEASLKRVYLGTLKDAAHWTAEQNHPDALAATLGAEDGCAWRLKRRLRQLFVQCSGIAETRAMLVRWISLVTCCQLSTFNRLAATVKKHRHPRTLPFRLEQRLCRSDQRTRPSGQGARQGV